MPSEAHRGFIRIASNYARLLSGLVLGIVYVPLMIRWVGVDGLGLVGLVGASVGLAGLFRGLTEQSMVRELAAAYHRDDEEHFLRFYNSAYLVAAASTAMTAIVFVVVLAVVPLFKVPEEWIGPARWIIVGQGAYACLLVLLAPAYSMYLVRERFTWYNAWMVAGRATALVSLLILAYGVGIRDVPTALAAHGLVWSGLLCVVHLVAVGVAIGSDRRLLPAPHRVRRAATAQISHTFGWNGAVVVAMALHDRVAQLLMNLAFGVFGNGVFDIGIRLSAYVRMATVGVTHGLEAVSARVSTREGAVHDLLRHSTRLQAGAAPPAGLFVFVLADPLLRLWLARSMEDPEAGIPAAVVIVRILMFAVVARCIADGWMFILYGAGYVRRYAPLLLTGGILSPIAGGLLLLLLDGPVRFFAPAAGYAGVYTLFHLCLLPVIGARCLDLRYGQLFAPLGRPAFVTLLCSPLVIVPALRVQTWTLPLLGGIALAFGLVYAALFWMIVLSTEERRRFAGAARRRLPSGAAK